MAVALLGLALNSSATIGAAEGMGSLSASRATSRFGDPFWSTAGEGSIRLRLALGRAARFCSASVVFTGFSGEANRSSSLSTPIALRCNKTRDFLSAA